MLVFDGLCQHGDFACAARRQYKPSLRRAHASQRPKQLPKPTDFDSQPRAMRFIDEPCSECARKEHIPRNVAGPRFCQRSCEREQHRTRCKRDHSTINAHNMTACVHDERFRCQQRFNLFEQEEPLFAACNQACGWRLQDKDGAFHLCRQGRDTCEARGAFRSSERGTRCLRLEASHRNPRNHEFVGGPGRRREGRGVQLGEHALRPVQMPYQEKAPDLKIPRMCGVQPVTVYFERCSRCVEQLRRPAQIARGECDLGFSDDAPRSGHLFFRSECTPCASQKFLRSYEFAELRHRDASKCERRRIVAQRNSLQCAERITYRQRMRCGCDY
jgi:hypothetical protein